MRVFDSLALLRQSLHGARIAGQRIGLVPTMGNLHEGHLALVREARNHCDFVLATIFVNPMQFGPGEDLARYPRTFDADLQALQSSSCDGVYAPEVEEMYPQGMPGHTIVSVPGLSTLHCGASRPGHFDGVCTVVNKLFNMIQPHVAVFGLKDYQQFQIISRMVLDLQMPIQLIGVPTVREASGLALSSRNGYLNGNQRRQAATLYATLLSTATHLRQGATDFAALVADARAALTGAGLRPDYVSICNRQTLGPAAPGERELVILAAAWVGTTRLIDNIQV
ncbi:MAG: pantoate--beta-alanine ligase [Pseudohongiellaceae bacterium]